MPTSAGIGTDTPPAGPLGASDETQSIKHMDEECTKLSCVGVTCLCALLSVVVSHFLVVSVFLCRPLNTHV